MSNDAPKKKTVFSRRDMLKAGVFGILAAIAAPGPFFAPPLQAAAKDARILVVYFSVPETANPDGMSRDEDNSVVVVDGQVLGNTQYVARLIQENTKGDIFRLEPKTPYPTRHAALLEVGQAERDRKARPELAANVENIEQYDVIFLGYPNWYADMPMILYSFLESVDLSGKTIIPFNTHGGSGFSDTISTIAELQPQARVSRNGFAVSRTKAQNCAEDVKSWLKKLDMD